jgi:hypothetical protein
MSWCIVVEWGDGSVDVNGPYDSEEKVLSAVEPLVVEIARDWSLEPHYDGGALKRSATLGEDWDDQIYVYVRQMGTPVVVPS